MSGYQVNRRTFLADAIGAPFVGYTAENGAPKKTVESNLREAISAIDFGAKPDAVYNGDSKTWSGTNNTEAFRAAVTYCWLHGKAFLIPAGSYIGKINLPTDSAGYEYRGDAFILVGEGAGNGFLGGEQYVHGTTIISPDGNPALHYHNYRNSVSANHVYVRNIRFEGYSNGPVVHFERFSDFSVIEECEIRQHGNGNGLQMDHAYGGTVQNMHVMNDDLVASWGARKGTGVSIANASALSGGLLSLKKITARGFQTGFDLGADAVLSLLATRIEQCECSTVDFGIKIRAGMRKAVIDNCYFEAVANTCVQDKGWGTSVSNCFMFEGYSIGIDNAYNTYANEYRQNYFQTNTANSTCIAIASSGDTNGYKKTIDGNFFYFLGSGGTVTGVSAITLTGNNPCVDVVKNTFRPRREWVGGAGTKKINDQSTGINTGAMVATDAINEFPMMCNVGISLAYQSTQLTQANVAGGVLSLGAASSFDINAGAPVDVTSIDIANKNQRLVMLRTMNSNMNFKKGATMKLSADFAGPGILTVDIRIIGGVTYAFEVSRAMH